VSRRLLIVTAVEAERAAVLAGLGQPDGPVDERLAGGTRFVVDAVGVGVAAAAAKTAVSLLMGRRAGHPFDAVISIGIAGGFAGRAEVGSTVLASRSVAADLGADSPEGFLSLSTLGFGQSTLDVDEVLLGRLGSALPDAVVGDVLTVATVTGTAEGAATLLARWPGAVAEAMEGFGVATAAADQGVAFAELRTISNPIGPRNRASWRIREALAALTRAAAQLGSLA
jgi:futalosine hydrolase